MAKMDQYPEPRRAVPMDVLRPSRTTKILTPGIVFVAVIIQAAASIAGIVIAVSIFNSKSPFEPGESAAQVFVLIASSISVVYILLHVGATLKNEPVGVVRPPERRIHGYCFITARLALVAWTITLVVLAVAISKSTERLRETRDCNLQILDVVGSSLAFLSTGILLTALESCNDLFQLPAILSRTVTCRISEFGSDLFEQSTRSSVRDDESVFEEMQYSTVMERPIVIRKPLPPKPSSLRRLEIPGEFPTEISPPQMAQNSRARGWGQEWTHLVQDESTNAIWRSESSASNPKSSSCTSTSDQSTNSSVSQRVPRPRTVTPSSSISNQSRRSPLSTMRSIDFPEVPIPAQLRYLPLVSLAPYDRNHSKSASLAQLLPVADTRSPLRRSSQTPEALRITEPITMLPPEFAPKFKRITLDVKIPGAFIDYHPSLEDSMKLEEHARKIELESIASIRNALKVSGPVRLPSGECEKHYTSNTLDSRTRYRHHKYVDPFTTTFQSTDNHADSAVCMEAVKVKIMKVEIVKSGKQARGKKRRRRRRKEHFKRLTIGDISPELGLVWNENNETIK